MDNPYRLLWDWYRLRCDRVRCSWGVLMGLGWGGLSIWGISGSICLGFICSGRGRGYGRGVLCRRVRGCSVRGISLATWEGSLNWILGVWGGLFGRCRLVWLFIIGSSWARGRGCCWALQHWSFLFGAKYLYW